jgi:protein-L-isoaspartate(D-aspartate) O-methyltransferase
MTSFTVARQKMVDGQIRPNDVTDLRLIDALLDVPREAFVRDEQRGLAYLDLDVEVSEGNTSKRYLIKPQVIAKLLQAAQIISTDRVLVVGCAGYTAALAAKLAADVVATESDPTLALKAQGTLSALGITNVTVVTASAAAGDPAHAPYDVIVLAGATQIAPEGLYRQLSNAGRLVGIFASHKAPRAEIVTRSPGDFGNRLLFDAYAPILPGLERPPAFIF